MPNLAFAEPEWEENENGLLIFRKSGQERLIRPREISKSELTAPFVIFRAVYMQLEFWTINSIGQYFLGQYRRQTVSHLYQSDMGSFQIKADESSRHNALLESLKKFTYQKSRDPWERDFLCSVKKSKKYQDPIWCHMSRPTQQFLKKNMEVHRHKKGHHEEAEGFFRDKLTTTKIIDSPNSKVEFELTNEDGEW